MDTLIQATPEYNPETSLLIIDDDANLLKNFRKLFSNSYDVKTAMSAKEAITTIKLGFVPGVIIADQDMPHYLGSKLLSDLTKLVPNATKILLFTHVDSKIIAEHLNISKAFHFLIKPITDIEIIQSVKIAFERFKLQKGLGQQKQIITSHTEKIQQLSKKLSDNDIENIKIKDDFSALLAETINSNDRYFYYQNKTNYVKDISKYIAKKISIRTENILLLEKLSDLLPIIHSGFPIKFKLAEVFEFTDPKDILIYISLFNKNFEKYQKYPRFKTYFDILEQIYEHNDGTGIPKYIKGMELYREAIIISIANLYHDLVYKISFEDWVTLNSNGSLTQTAETTIKRHEKAIKFINNRSDWFSVEVFNAFNKVLKDGDCESLIPKNQDLKILL